MYSYLHIYFARNVNGRNARSPDTLFTEPHVMIKTEKWYPCKPFESLLLL